MDVNGIVKALSRTGQARATFYLNRDTVSMYFTQAITAISAVVRSEKLAPEVSANLGLISAKLGGDKGWGATVALDDPLVKAMLIEHEARVSGTLVDLQENEPAGGTMLWYVGAPRVFDVIEEVSKDSGLPDTIACEIQKERERQQTRLQARDPARRTIVWTATSPRYMAAICSDEWVHPGLLTSYATEPPIGLLGRLERQLGQVTLIAPFWIWHEGW
ncbi:MAG TPA: hypothetical protein VKB88_36595 [Bryobacteraceae bacterium]|nr:hypothetical protein [Bryobacteraceae bacterium]